MGSFLSSLGKDINWSPRHKHHKHKKLPPPRTYLSTDLSTPSPKYLRRKRKRSYFGDCMGYDNIPSPFYFGLRKRRSKRKSNKNAAKAMKYYQSHKHQGVTLRDAWKIVKKESHKPKLSLRKFKFGYDDDNDEGTEQFGSNDLSSNFGYNNFDFGFTNNYNANNYNYGNENYENYENYDDYGNGNQYGNQYGRPSLTTFGRVQKFG